MDGERWRRVDELYHAALEREARQRAEFLARECGADAELRREVESLLDFDDHPDRLLESPAWNHLGSSEVTVLKEAGFAPGAQLGVYRILERLGAGGMGEVYRALDTRLTREVALKVMSQEMNANQAWRQRFAREAQAASRLNHPHIVTIYDIGEEDGVHFIAMEYIAGKTLAQSIGPSGMPVARAARYAAQVAGALSKAHAAGVIHRDVKPANIMITEDGLAKVLDFGLAKLEPVRADGAGSAIETAATQAGMILGSAAYMSPEQASGRPVDARSDIFSWGVLFYEMLSGRRAFREESRFSTMAAILHKEAEPLGPDIPAEMREIVVRCLRKDPAARFQSMADVMAALEAARGGHTADNLSLTDAGQTVSNYRLLVQLREEASGVVFKAEDTRLERLVALKILPRRTSGNGPGTQQFLREARTASALEHSNIGTVYEAGEMPDGRVFIAAAFYEGGSLEDKIQSGISVAQAIDYARQAALGLAKAHARGIVHGGIRAGCLMLTSEGVVKIVDFGLGMPGGVSPYSPPAPAEPADARDDIWSLGAVLFAMISGHPPPVGAAAGSLKQLRPETPRGLVAIVQKATEKEAALRYGSAQQMADELAALTATPGRMSPAARWVAVAAAVAVAAGIGWFVVRQKHVRWAREVALPEIVRLSEQDRNGAAMALARQVREYLPNDPAVHELWNRISADINIDTEPPGATVEVKDYLTPEAPWTRLGVTPIHKTRFPWGYSRVRISKPGRETFEFIHQVQGEVSPDLKLTLEAAGTWPAGMVKVPVRRFLSAFATLDVSPITSEFYLDRNEVSNREFQKFVDAGGYRDRRFWKEEFVKDGHRLSWEDAVAQFVDATNEPGPATWDAGRFPEGKGDLPVTGVSWYEAAAYAEFAGKSLPTVSHWYAAAYPSTSPAVIRLSNFDNVGLAPVGKYRGVSAGGANDMGGNAKEWCWNAANGKRYILGGAWHDPAYQFTTPDAQAPLDRSPENGFRCARYLITPEAALLAPMPPKRRDYSKEKPVSDDVFRGYQALYVYERLDPKGRVDSEDNTSPDWVRQQVSYDAGHDNERMPAVLFLPKNVSPPYQVVVYFPGSGAFLYPNSKHDLVAFYQLDYLIRGGRAVLCPVYEDTYERRRAGTLTTMQFRDREINWSKEVERSLDYLETRKEIDAGKIAFMGFSMGVRPAVQMAAYPPRVKTLVILSGGFYAQRTPPEVDLLNFAPRLKIPTLMVNGRYDFTFPLEEYQRPLFRVLGAPEKDKKLALLEYAHNVGAIPTPMRREVLFWLDKYLGAAK